MGKIIYYVAASLDGFISDELGSVEWLNPFNNVGYDYGYSDFYGKIGFIITGSKTYEQAKNFPGGWAFPNTETYVFSSRDLNTNGQNDIHLWKNGINELSRILREKEKDTWLIGGANLAGQFANAGLLDELILSVMPVMLGDGKPLFGGVKKQIPMKLEKNEHFQNGVVQLTYTFL